MTLDIKQLTTPEEIDQHVASFCRTLSTENPVFIDVKPELWCKQSNCEMNVDKFIELQEGEKVIGYKIWYIKRKYIEAERHVVYRNNGQFRDLTFNRDGETKVLFIPDNGKFTYEDKPLIIRCGLTQGARIFAKECDKQYIHRQQLSPDDSWNRMISYEEWLSGKRMPDSFFMPTDN
ncbi:hypothetical protein ACLEEZ_10710 [Lonsdalea quercina]|uniref:hypothetical protein n=1 Tax=Lonsdalea quercina TaxID=71657 RepID=UPI003976C06E